MFNRREALAATAAAAVGTSLGEASELPAEKGTDVPPKLKDRVFLLVSGAVLPGSHDGGMAVPLRSPLPNGNEVWVEKLSELPPTIGPYWPYHRPHFRVDLEVTIGTVDELVELYRELLIKAVTSMAAGPFPYKDAAQNLADATRLGYAPGKALSRPLFSDNDEVVQDHREKAAACLALASQEARRKSTTQVEAVKEV